MPCSLLWEGFISGRPASSDLSKSTPGMLVPSTLLHLTVVLALPLMSALGDQEQTLAGCNGDQFWANVTRRSDGDAWTSSCPRCDAMCRQAKAARLRCSLREYLCTCQCLDNRTFRNDINLCVDSFSDCRATPSAPSQIQFVDFNQLPLAQDSPHASTVNRGERSARCQVKNTRVLKCGGWRNLDSLNMTERGLHWNITVGTGNAEFGVWWTGTSEAFRKLSGYVLSLEISCYHGNKVTTSCAVVKMAGTRGYAVPIEPSSTHPPVVIAPETELGSSTTEGAIPKLLDSNNSTTIANYTKELTDEEYKRLEMLVTAICLSVSILLCVLLTCFALEKRIQSKKRGSEKQCASQTRTYTHEVSHCRKTLMDVYDMPMIRFNASMSGSGEDDDASSPPVIQLKKKDKDMVLSEIKADHEADGEESTSPSSSELRIGSSSEMLASESSTVPGSYLGVQQKSSTDPEFKNWRPCAKQSPPGTGSKSMSSLSPTKKKNPPGILKRSPNTSPTRSPNRSPSLMRWSVAKKATVVKKPPVVHKGWTTVVARHFQQQKQPHQNAEGIEMRPVNGMATPEPQAPKRSILKHGSRWKALAPKLAPMVCAEEFAEDTHQDASTTQRNSDNHHVVIKCEVHDENERREMNVDSKEKAYTERSPLTRSIKMVLDSKADPQGKKNCIEWRRKDYDGVPCTDV